MCSENEGMTASRPNLTTLSTCSSRTGGTSVWSSPGSSDWARWTPGSWQSWRWGGWGWGRRWGRGWLSLVTQQVIRGSLSLQCRPALRFQHRSQPIIIMIVFSCSTPLTKEASTLQTMIFLLFLGWRKRLHYYCGKSPTPEPKEISRPVWRSTNTYDIIVINWNYIDVGCVYTQYV